MTPEPRADLPVIENDNAPGAPTRRRGRFVVRVAELTDTR